MQNKTHTVKVPAPWTKRDDWLWPTYDTKLLSAFDRVEDLSLVLPMVKKRRVAIQAGGACGVWPYFLSQYFDMVYTLEPEETNYLCLEQNCNDSNISFIMAALGRQPGWCTLKNNPGEAKNCGTWYLNPGQVGDIPVMTIDGLRLNEVDFICLDVEGYERYALEGAADTIRRCRPWIMFEAKPLPHLNKLKTSASSAKDYLIKEFGYKYVEKIAWDLVLRP